jgi:hypothetical protein
LDSIQFEMARRLHGLTTRRPGCQKFAQMDCPDNQRHCRRPEKYRLVRKIPPTAKASQSTGLGDYRQASPTNNPPGFSYFSPPALFFLQGWGRVTGMVLQGFQAF